MQLWMILGILSFLSYAVSTSIDKYMMNHKLGILRTNTFKMLFDAIILLAIGILFFELSFSSSLMLWSLVLGGLYALGGVIYYYTLKLKDVGELVPFSQSSEILLVFIGSLVLFNEVAVSANYLGVALILLGIYAVLSKNGISVPKIDQGVLWVVVLVIINVTYWLLAKKLIHDASPIALAIAMYFSSTLILFLYQAFLNKAAFKSLLVINHDMAKIGVSSFFGAMGTLLVFLALSVGNASKVYPLAATQSVFIFIISILFLKERFRWHRLIGTLLVFAGIFLVSM